MTFREHDERVDFGASILCLLFIHPRAPNLISLPVCKSVVSENTNGARKLES